MNEKTQGKGANGGKEPWWSESTLPGTTAGSGAGVVDKTTLFMRTAFNVCMMGKEWLCLESVDTKKAEVIHSRLPVDT